MDFLESQEPKIDDWKWSTDKGAFIIKWLLKVRTFWETHKIWKSLPHGFDKLAVYLVNVKTMKKIAQIFVAFAEKLKFTPM